MEPLFFLALTNNLVLSAVKWLADGSATKIWLRVILGVLSLVGIISLAALNNTPVNFNQFSDVGLLLLQALGVSLASHFSYKIVKYS